MSFTKDGASDGTAKIPAPNTVVVTRKLSVTYQVSLADYNGLTLDQALDFETTMAVGEVVELINGFEQLESAVTVAAVYNPEHDPSAVPDEVKPLVLDLDTE